MPDVTLQSQLASEIGRRIEASDHDSQTSDIRTLNTAKANKDDVAQALSLKADAQATADALALKASKTYTDSELAKKADATATSLALSQRATTGQLADAENTAFINSLLF